jgi:hypothetical protein
MWPSLLFLVLFSSSLLVLSTRAQHNSVIRTTNSVDVQLCVQTAFLTPQRDAFLQALIAYLTESILNSNALYLDRQYTTTDGGLCYLFVYQAPGPDNAVSVLERLAEQRTLSVPFGNAPIQCSVQAAQWAGDDLSYLGAPLPGLWTVNDLLLWGACCLTVVFLCMSGMCCYAFVVLRRQRGAKSHHPLPPPLLTTSTTHKPGMAMAKPYQHNNDLKLKLPTTSSFSDVSKTKKNTH